MAKYPGAKWAPLPENATQPGITPTQFIIHTAVDHPGPSNIPGYFARDDVTVESHFWIDLKGNVVQMMDTNVRADANLKGNVRAISVETEDEGDPEGHPWTPAQVRALVALIKWASATHSIPLKVMPNWYSPGLGWHSMWGFSDPINLTGMLEYSPWTPSRGKTCPGRTRIAQIQNEILPALQGPVKVSLNVEEDIMNIPIIDWYKLILEAKPTQFSAAVELWQRLLVAQGFDLPVDGKIGPATKTAHVQWAKSVGSGSVDPLPGFYQWRRLLNEMVPDDKGLAIAEAKIAKALEALTN